MTKQMMVYENAVPVSSERHRDWSVQMGKNFSFARNLNAVPLLAAELLSVASTHTIVFSGDENTVLPMAILSLEQDKNDFVAEDGSWTGPYVPAFLRRYPFVFSRSEDGQSFTLCLDEEFEDFNVDGRGERLFDSEGKQTQFLEGMLNFTREYQALFQRTSVFCERLVKNDMLEPATAQFKLPDGETRSLTGFQTISRDKLKALDPEILAEMVKTDELELCYTQIHSLNNLTPLAQKFAS